MSTRKVYKLVIFGNLTQGNEERQIEAKNEAEALKIAAMLRRGRPYFALRQIMEVKRND